MEVVILEAVFFFFPQTLLQNTYLMDSSIHRINILALQRKERKSI